VRLLGMYSEVTSNRSQINAQIFYDKEGIMKNIIILITFTLFSVGVIGCAKSTSSNGTGTVTLHLKHSGS